MDRLRVTFDADEWATLERLGNVGTGASRMFIHARILLQADSSLGQGRPDTGIVSAMDTSLRTVIRVRQRLGTEGFPAAPDHRPQPARPGKVKGDGE